MDQSSVLVIGYGSIGARHAKVFKELGCTVGVVSRRSLDLKHYRLFSTIEDGLNALTPKAVIICSETARHKSDLDELVQLGYSGKVLIEKPLGYLENFDYPDELSKNWYVAYNMRYVAGLQKARELMKSWHCETAEAKCGFYLPYWRPDRDYRTNYSAIRKLGGGVLSDLSHELDYLMWLFGPYERVVGLGGQRSHLEIDSDDVFYTLISFKSGLIGNLILNYLDRKEERWVLVNAKEGTLRLDFTKHRIEINGEEVWQGDQNLGLLSYQAQNSDFLSDNPKHCCTFKEGLSIHKTIWSIEQSEKEKSWQTV